MQQPILQRDRNSRCTEPTRLPEDHVMHVRRAGQDAVHDINKPANGIKKDDASQEHHPILDEGAGALANPCNTYQTRNKNCLGDEDVTPRECKGGQQEGEKTSDRYYKKDQTSILSVLSGLREGFRHALSQRVPGEPQMVSTVFPGWGLPRSLHRYSLLSVESDNAISKSRRRGL